MGDEVEAVFARALALHPKERPRDAGEFWGMLKHAIQVDARSGKAPRSDAHADAGGPAVDARRLPGAPLRLDERAPAPKTPVIELPPPYALPDLGARGGTLRVDPGAGREVLDAAARRLRGPNEPDAQVRPTPVPDVSLVGAARPAARAPVPARSRSGAAAIASAAGDRRGPRPRAARARRRARRGARCTRRPPAPAAAP